MNNDSFGGSPVAMSQRSPSGGGRKRDAQSLVPLTVKQLLQAEEENSKYKVDGRTISQVTIVGQILSVEAQATNVNYLVDDSTGKVNVRIYIDSDDDSDSTLSSGTYVRVVGNLRAFNDKKSVVAFQLIPVTDFNEVTFHYLNVIATHLRFTKQPGNNTPAKIPGATTSTFGQAQAQPMQMMNTGGVPQMGGLEDAKNGQFTPVQQQILQVFKTGGDDETGLSVDALFSAMPNVPQAQIREALGFLSDEGHLYTTIDENHFKSTDE